MKYKEKDFDRLVEIFSNLSEKKSAEEVSIDDINGLVDYPVNVIQEFLKAIEAINPDENIEENINGIKLYVLLRMNLVDMIQNQNQNPDI